MLTVACVLRSGGDFWPEHVTALRDSVARHLTLPHRFVCLSDIEVDCERIPLKHGWPSWWSKLELFSSALFGAPVLYFDLDTIIVRSLDEIALGHRFTVLQNFWSDVYKDPERIGSGIMAWNASAAVYELQGIYLRFAQSPDRFIAEYRTKERWGDQGFIKDHSPVPPELWQRKHPGKVVSFKKHVLPARAVPKGASVVCFHGRPRPFSLPLGQRAWFSEAA